MGDVIDLTKRLANINDAEAEGSISLKFTKDHIVIEQEDTRTGRVRRVVVAEALVNSLALDLASCGAEGDEFGEFTPDEFDELFAAAGQFELADDTTPLGVGTTRTVYAHLLDSSLVIKLAKSTTGVQANFLEWTTWERLKGHPAAQRWLAPCVAMNGAGTVLLQRRTQPLSGPVPADLPAWLARLEPNSFGMMNGRVVAHGYSRHRAMEVGLGKA